MGLGDSVTAIASLGDPLRRSLYEHVVAAGHAVTRNGAAEAVGVPRSVAAFHLDRLVEEGLLEASFRRLNDRRGPGAGRPSKLYRRAACEITVSLPARHYELAAHLLAEAIAEAEAGGGDVHVALAQVAHRRGVEAGSEASGARGDPIQALTAAGFEPHASQGGDGVVLANCPFHQLAGRHPDLVCAMNVAFVGGVLQGCGALAAYQAVPDPQPGRCCVRIAAARKEP